jgi:hypothetical protein
MSSQEAIPDSTNAIVRPASPTARTKSHAYLSKALNIMPISTPCGMQSRAQS